MKVMSVVGTKPMGADQRTILDGVGRMLNARIEDDTHPYGDGKASERIVDVLVEMKR